LQVEGAEECTARVLDDPEGGAARLDFGPDQARLAAALEKAGEIPLPPYISRPEGPTAEDTSDYQTIFARRPGAVAAPTASLHFTEALLQALEERGVARPVRSDDARAHKLHEEWGEITPEAAARLNAVRGAGGRIIAIGTTALRLLESAVLPDGTIQPFRGLTDVYLLPGHAFRSADALMTNFHLPRSTLFMLVCAFAGDQRMRAAYAHAIAQSYRFYSYGDSSLLFRAEDTP
jgi:S-adenosylmethionine:tRNA ribosyltransferase-isomerase